MTALIERHVLAASRLHGDNTIVPILAKGQTVKGHIWTYVRDDRPFGARVPPAALYYASRDRRHEHPAQYLRGFSGILQADAYSGYNELRIAVDIGLSTLQRRQDSGGRHLRLRIAVRDMAREATHVGQPQRLGCSPFGWQCRPGHGHPRSPPTLGANEHLSGSPVRYR
jgi:hypothetical protein